MTSIESILYNNGPLLSGELADILLKKGGNRESVRKQISRAKFPVCRIRGFFSDNQSFYYLKDQYKQEIYFDGLYDAFKKSAKRFYAIVKALEYHHGYMKTDHLASYAFSPIKNLKGHKNCGAILDELVKLNVISFEEDCYALQTYLMTTKGEDFRKYKAIETAKNFILTQFLSWARSLGLSSYNTGAFYSEVGKFQWGFTSPSYISSLTSMREGKKVPAFILADVLIGEVATEDDINFFIEKVKILNFQKNISRFIPFLIVDNLTNEALKQLKANGIVIGFVNKLFGYEYSDLLKSLINTITNAGAILKKNPEVYLDLISKLNKLVDGKTNNLRGDLFELAVGFYHGKFCKSLDIGKLINYQGERREIDVFANYTNELRLAECKGYKNKVSLQEIEKWLNDNVPIIRKWIVAQSAYNNKKIIFELWSTGGFEDDALERLKHAVETTKKYKIEYYDKLKIIEKAKEVKSQKFIDILKQYYFNDDL